MRTTDGEKRLYLLNNQISKAQVTEAGGICRKPGFVEKNPACQESLKIPQRSVEGIGSRVFNHFFISRFDIPSHE